MRGKQRNIMKNIIELSPRNPHNQKESAESSGNKQNGGDLIQDDYRNRRKINNKSEHSKQIIKCNAISEDIKFTAGKIIKRTWVHVANFQLDLTAEELTEYLNKKFHRDDFICFKIKPKHKSPKFSSFKIGADISLEETLLNPNSWNSGIAVCKFDFFLAARNKLLFERRNKQDDTDF